MINWVLIFVWIFITSTTFSYAAAPIKEIQAEELSRLIIDKKKVVVLDVRSARFDDRKRLPGAISVPYNTPQKNIFDKIPSKDITVVVYCGSSKCPSSQYMAERLIRMGYKSVLKYTDGISAWIAGGRLFENSKEPIIKE